MSLRALPDLQPIYLVPRQDLIGEVIIPCLKIAEDYRCMVGFFDSRSLAELAPGLAEFFQRPDAVMHLLASPFVSADDQAALRSGVDEPEAILTRRMIELVGEARASQRALVNYTLDSLAFLLARGQLRVKLVLVRDGMFHPKVWLFRDESDDVVVAHGSSNLTVPGLLRNIEQVSTARSWGDERERSVIRGLEEEFDSLWRDERDYAKTFELPDAVRSDILRDRGDAPAPSAERFWEAWSSDVKAQLGEAEPRDAERPAGFHMPAGLNIQDGAYAHQKVAVDNWENAGRRGIFEMATGSGKTIAALVAAYQLQEELKRAHERPLLMIVAAPYLPLIAQWEQEARLFGLAPVTPGRVAGRRNKLAAVDEALSRLTLGASDVECLIITHDLLCDEEFTKLIARASSRLRSLLIADEVHNLGRAQFLKSPPDVVEYRLGLSATPVRQYDPEGTAFIQDFFGEIIFQFTLDDAIGKCLVPYDYWLHPIELTEGEISAWLEVTTRLRQLGYTDEDQVEDRGLSDLVRVLLIKRRRILEQASGKVGALAALIGAEDPRRMHHVLIYASDKGRAQLRSVNELLAQRGIRFHQLTSAETAQPGRAAALLSSFASSQLQVLTAMRVLDEGVNIPEITTAYILASTTVERQWVQRRGRILRLCERIAKKKAVLHDFMVLPSQDALLSSPDSRMLLRSELRRAREFSRLADNAARPGGPLGVIQQILQQYFVEA